MRHILIILSVLASIAVAEDKPQPHEVTQAASAYEKGVTAAHRIYEKAEAKVRDDVLRTLERAKVDYTKKGDLEGALMVDAYMKKIKAGEAMAAVEGKLKEGLFTKAPSVADVVGKWKYTKKGWDVSITFTADNKFATSDNLSGIWIIQDGVIKFTVKDSQWWNTIKNDGSGDTWDGGVNSAKAQKLQ